MHGPDSDTQPGARVSVALQLLSRLWLPIVTLVTVGFWWLSFQFNPTAVPTWSVLAVFWLWMWCWWRAHHLVAILDVTWFEPRMLVVTLAVVGLVWSIGLPLFRDQVLLRSMNPEQTIAVVVTGVEGDTQSEVNVEVLGGLILSRVGVIEYGDSDRPTSFAIEWVPREGHAVLEADSRPVAVIDYAEGKRSLRPHPLSSTVKIRP